jgi:hypothetical protein
MLRPGGEGRMLRPGDTPSAAFASCSVKGQTRRVDFLFVGIVCAAGIGIPIALGLTDPHRRRRPRGR